MSCLRKHLVRSLSSLQSQSVILSLRGVLSSCHTRFPRTILTSSYSVAHNYVSPEDVVNTQSASPISDTSSVGTRRIQQHTDSRQYRSIKDRAQSPKSTHKNHGLVHLDQRFRKGERSLKFSLEHAKRSKNFIPVVETTIRLLERKALNFKDGVTAINVFKFSKQPKKCFEVLCYLQDLASKTNSKLSTFHYNPVIASFASAKDSVTAIELLTDMKANKINPGVYTYSTVISACDKDHGRWKMAIKLLREMQKAGLAPNTITYSCVISACSKGGHWEAAIELLREMQGFDVAPNIITYNSAIYACAKGGGQWETAISLLREMQSGGITPSTVTYNTVISACESSGTQSQMAINLLREMQGRGLAPDVTTYSAVISACKQDGGQWETAVSLLKEMQSGGFVPNTVTYNAAISACEKGGGQWVMAIMLLQEMQRNDVAPNTKTYSIVISACEKSGQWGSAVKAFLQMGEIGIERNTAVYRSVIQALGKHGGMNDRIDQFYEHMTAHITLGVNCWAKLSRTGYLDLHGHNEHMGRSAIRMLLKRFQTERKEPAHKPAVEFKAVVIGKEDSSEDRSVLMETIQSQLLADMTPPIGSCVDSKDTSLLVLDAKDLEIWLQHN
eukprot:CFRG1604T1